MSYSIKEWMTNNKLVLGIDMTVAGLILTRYLYERGMIPYSESIDLLIRDAVPHIVAGVAISATTYSFCREVLNRSNIESIIISTMIGMSIPGSREFLELYNGGALSSFKKDIGYSIISPPIGALLGFYLNSRKNEG